jgi:hypothetical protein
LETFNIHFSILKFLKSVAAEFDLHVFLNQKLTAAEEELLQTLDRWLIITLDEDDTDILQPVFVKLALFATAETDPTTLWLKRTPHQFNAYCLQRKTHPTLNLIAIYDYDTYVGATALETFRKTAEIPATLLDALALDPPTIGYYEPCNQHVGLQILTQTAPNAPDVDDIPYKSTWRITFRYFQPEHMMGAVSL